MNDDLISRSRLLRDPYFREDRYPVSHLLRMAIMEQPAVNLEEVFKSLPHVKEALEMAKQTVAPVRAGRWVMTLYTTTSKRGRVISNKRFACSECEYSNGRKQSNYCPNCGVKMESGTALSKAEPLAGCADDADLEHMTRFAMQQALQRK